MRVFRAFGLGIILAFVGFVQAQPVTITLWDLLTGGDGVRFQEIVDNFNSSQDRVQVERTTLEWGVPFYTKVRTSVAAGQQPDVVTYHLSRLPSAVPDDLLQPISDADLASVDLSRDDFLPSLIDKATFDGELYAIPIDIHPLVLYYNKDLLEEAGLLGPDGLPLGIEGIDNFTNALRQVKEQTGKLGVSLSSEGGTAWRLWYSLVNQQNAQVFSEGRVSFGEAGVQALEDIAGWVGDGLAPRSADYPASVALFTRGDAAFFINGVWEVPTMVDLAASGELPFEYGVMPLPQLYEQQATWADSSTLAIPNSPRDPMSEETRQAVLEFIAFVEQNELIWASGGHLPAYLPVFNSAEYKAMEPNADYAAAGAQVVFEPDVVIAGAAGPVMEAAENFLTPAIDGQIPVDQALEGFTEQLERDLASAAN